MTRGVVPVDSPALCSAGECDAVAGAPAPCRPPGSRENRCILGANSHSIPMAFALRGLIAAASLLTISPRQGPDVEPARPRPPLCSGHDRTVRPGAVDDGATEDEIRPTELSGRGTFSNWRRRGSRTRGEMLRLAIGVAVATACTTMCIMMALPRIELVQTSVGTYGEDGGGACKCSCPLLLRPPLSKTSDPDAAAGHSAANPARAQVRVPLDHACECPRPIRHLPATLGGCCSL